MKGRVPDSVRVPLTLVRRFSGAALALPELPAHPRSRDPRAHPRAAPHLGSDDGWQARFGRELNATDDREHFGAAGLPVLEGKLVDAFAARGRGARNSSIRSSPGGCSAADRASTGRGSGYREVAASTNRMTLIAAIIPAACVTTHTIFCMREPRRGVAALVSLRRLQQLRRELPGRLRGGTHVPAAVIHQLPVPVLPHDSERSSRRSSGSRAPPRTDPARLASASRAAGARDARVRPGRARFRSRARARFRWCPRTSARRRWPPFGHTG